MSEQEIDDYITYHWDGCIYDTVFCDHSCPDCEYGTKSMIKQDAIEAIKEQPYFG